MSKTIGCIELFAGFIILMVGFGLVAGGAGVLVANTIFTDGEGYFKTTDITIEEQDVQAIRYDLPKDMETPTIHMDLSKIVIMKLEAMGRSGGAVVAGILPKAEADAYLANTSYYLLTDLDLGHRFHQSSYYAGYTIPAKNETPVEPTANDWIMGGESGNKFYWNPTTNDFQEPLSVLILVPEPGNDFSVTFSVGAKVGILLPISIVMLIFGAFIFIAGAILIGLGVSALRSASGSEHYSNQGNVSYVRYSSDEREKGDYKARIKQDKPLKTAEVSTTQSNDNPRYCPKCGLLTQADSIYCPDCGAKL